MSAEDREKFEKMTPEEKEAMMKKFREGRGGQGGAPGGAPGGGGRNGGNAGDNR